MSCTTPTDYTPLGFSGPGHICSRCAQDAHRAANKTTAKYVAPNFDLAVLSARIYPIQPGFFTGACWSCGELAALLPAHEYGVTAPTEATHHFAEAVLNAWLNGPASGADILSVRACSEAGRHWVAFKPAGGSLHIHTEATRNHAEAVARFIQAATH